MSLKLNQLRAFSEVAEWGSIRAASRSLGISQPAVTKSLRDLEESLGTQVVIRGNQGITLTAAGEQLLSHTTLILRELSLAEESVKQGLGNEYGTVNVGVGASIACELMPEVISKFRQLYPNVQVKIQEGQLEAHIDQLRQGKMDFVINTLQSDLEEYEFTKQKVMELPFKIIARKDHPKLKAKTLEELQDCDWVMPTTRSSYLNTVYDILSQNGAQLKHAITCESYLSTLAIISHTDCIGLVSSTAVEHYTYAQQLEEITLDTPLPWATYYLLCRKSSPLTPIAHQLAELFLYQSRPLFARVQSETTSDS